LFRTSSAEERYNRIPAKRFGLPEEIGGAVAFLIGEDSTYCFGTNIAVDGALRLS